MTTSSSSHDWVSEIDPNLKQLDSIPLTGATPPFPWDDFSHRLAQSFNCDDLKIVPGEVSWRTKEDLYEGMGDSPFPLIISVPSIKGQICWVMPAQEIPLLAALLLTKESHPLPLHDQLFNESFYRFLAVEVLYHFTQVPFDQTLSPILTHQTKLPNEDSLCRDISLQMNRHTTRGRLIISPQFRSSWVEHFAQKGQSSPLSEEMRQLVNVAIHLEAGKAQLNLADWMSIKLGDFLTLDSCSLDPQRLDGRIILTINGKPTFRAKLKEGTLKISELPLLHEVETSMAKQPENEDEISDFDLSEHDAHTENDDDLSESDDDLFSDTDDDLFADETEETDTDPIASEEREEALDKPSKKPQPTHNQEIKKNHFISPEQIPVTVVVEVGQVEMTMDKLLKLEPGNLLDVNLHPENGVDLTINGQVVGKGELIRIGDVIGVRILQLGH